MSRFGAVGDAITGFGKAAGAVNPQAIKITSSMPDLGNLAKGFGKIDGLGDAAKGLGKVDGLGDAAKGLGKVDGLGDAAKGLNKVDDVGDAAKGLNKVDDVGDAAKGLGKTDDVAKTADDAKGVLDWAKKNPGKALAGAGASAGALYAANEFMKNDGKKVGITKIEAASEGGLFGVGATDIAKITFTPELDALSSDTLKIEGTDCVPPIDGTDVAIFKIYSKTVIGVKVDKKLTSPGTKGSLTLSTTVAARAGAAVGEGAGAAGEVIGGAAGGVGGAAGNVLTSFLRGLGIPLPEGLPGMLIVGCVILLCLFIAFKIFF